MATAAQREPRQQRARLLLKHLAHSEVPGNCATSFTQRLIQTDLQKAPCRQRWIQLTVLNYLQLGSLYHGESSGHDCLSMSHLLFPCFGTVFMCSTCVPSLALASVCVCVLLSPPLCVLVFISVGLFIPWPLSVNTHLDLNSSLAQLACPSQVVSFSALKSRLSADQRSNGNLSPVWGGCH